MDYIRTDTAGQLVFEHSSEYLLIPSCLYGFRNTETTQTTSKSGRSVFVHYGSLKTLKRNASAITVGAVCTSTTIQTSRFSISLLEVICVP